MNSLRPIATISLLGIVGLFLYMKINETDPVVPVDAMTWDMSGDLDIGEVEIGGAEIGNVDIGASPADVNATVSAAPVESLAPAFVPVPNASVAPSFESAPAFNSAASASPPAAHDTQTNVENIEITPAMASVEPSIGAPSVGTSTINETVPTASDSRLPPLPALPPLPTSDSNTEQAMTSPATGRYGESISSSVPSSESMSAPVASTPEFPTEDPITPTESLQPETQSPAGQASLFASTRVAVQSALDRGELSQALLLLSDWYGDPSLSPAEAAEVQNLLSQLAGSVIYSTEHRLEPPYMVQAGERLEDIAQKHNVPWQLLAKINGLSSPEQLQPGQQLKVVRGPFSARIDLGERKLVLMLDRRYAGQFAIDVDSTSSIEEGYWAVNQKLLTPGNVGMLDPTAAISSEDRSLLLTNASGGSGQVTILRGPGGSSAATDPAGRIIQLNSTDVGDVYDILSLGSQVVIRR